MLYGEVFKMNKKIIAGITLITIVILIIILITCIKSGKKMNEKEINEFLSNEETIYYNEDNTIEENEVSTTKESVENETVIYNVITLPENETTEFVEIKDYYNEEAMNNLKEKQTSSEISYSADMLTNEELVSDSLQFMYTQNYYDAEVLNSLLTQIADRDNVNINEYYIIGQIELDGKLVYQVVDAVNSKTLYLEVYSSQIENYGYIYKEINNVEAGLVDIYEPYDAVKFEGNKNLIDIDENKLGLIDSEIVKTKIKELATLYNNQFLSVIDSESNLKYAGYILNKYYVRLNDLIFCIYEYPEIELCYVKQLLNEDYINFMSRQGN